MGCVPRPDSAIRRSKTNDATAVGVGDCSLTCTQGWRQKTGANPGLWDAIPSGLEAINSRVTTNRVISTTLPQYPLSRSGSFSLLDILGGPSLLSFNLLCGGSLLLQMNGTPQLFLHRATPLRFVWKMSHYPLSPANKTIDGVPVAGIACRRKQPTSGVLLSPDHWRR